MTGAAPWVIDGRGLQGGSGVRGIGSYLRGLLGGLHDLGVDERVELLLRRSDPPPDLPPGWAARPGPRLPALKRRLQPLADPFLVAAVLLRRPAALYHAVEYAQPIVARAPVVVTVHDLIPFVVRDGYTWMRRERLLAVRQLRHAEAVITPSQATADDAVRVARVRRERISVIPHGVAAAFRPAPAERVASTRERLGLDRPFLLAVGTFDAHKRLKTLLEVAARVCPVLGLDLVVAGDQGVYRPQVRATVTASPVAGHVHLVGRVGLADLVDLYSGARCLVHSSAYEGFGLPLLEAMACGCPVAAFANSAIPEVCGSAGVTVADGDAGELAGAVAALAVDGPERERRVTTGLAWAAEHTWERAARATIDVYGSLAP